MKTVFITSFHPLISRNILQTKFPELLTAEARAVLLVPDFKKDFFEREFRSKNLIVEGVNTDLKKSDLFFRKLALILCPSKTLSIKMRSEARTRHNPFAFLVYWLLSRLFGRRTLALKLARAADYFFYRQSRFQELFQKYAPDLVFSTDVQNELDVRLLQDAARLRVKSLGMVRSWDNLTAKGVLRVFPDKLAVQNDIIKGEAWHYSRFPGKSIAVIGIPHYDRYLEARQAAASGDFGKTAIIKKRVQFFAEFGFDISKKLVLFAPAGRRYIGESGTDKYVLEILSELDLNILVRIPPGDSANFDDFKSRRAKVVFDYSGVSEWRGGRKLNELSRSDDNRLLNEFCSSDMVVAHLATMCVDAAFFDKPTVVIGFDKEKLPYLKSIERYFDYDHLQPVLKSGGLRIAKSSEELIASVTAYFNNPKLDQDGRERIVKAEVQFSDGKASERLKDVITSYS